MAKAEMPGMDKDWQAESDLRTLIEAEKIRKDKGRMAAAMKKRAEMTAALAAVDKGTPNKEGK